jgi:CheY-like chemotaxis protein
VPHHVEIFRLASPPIVMYRSKVAEYVKLPSRSPYIMANVLIVDDEEMDRFLESRVVEDAGHTPVFAGDGEAALEVYRENDIALVITDLRMPKMDGLRFIRDLLEYDPDAQIIVVSGAEDQLAKAERLGARAGLVKPIEPEKLIERVQEVLSNLTGGGDMWGSGW